MKNQSRIFIAMIVGMITAGMFLSCSPDEGNNLPEKLKSDSVVEMLHLLNTKTWVSVSHVVFILTKKS